MCTNVVCKLETNVYYRLMRVHFATGGVQGVTLQGLLLKYLCRQFEFIGSRLYAGIFARELVRGTGILLVIVYLLL